jgi:hypothetical protein
MCDQAVLPSSYGLPLEWMKSGTRRHVAFVFDHVADETRHYLDGVLLGTTKHPAGTIASMDCDMAGADA